MTKIIGKHLEDLHIIAMSLIVGGIIMWIVDVLYARNILPRHTENMDQMSLGQARLDRPLPVCVRRFPRTSRSMATIAARQLAGMTRSAALEVPVLLSIPTMVVAVCYEAHKTSSAAPRRTSRWRRTSQHRTMDYAPIGFVVSFIVAYAVVAWFMKWVRQHGFVPFAIWRLAVGIAVLIFAAKFGMTL